MYYFNRNPIFTVMRIGFLGQCLCIALFILCGSHGSAQTTIFNETFNEANMAVAGVDQFGTGWNVTCPTCEGHFEVRGNLLEQNNSGRVPGPNVLPKFTTNSIDITSCNTLTLSMNYIGDAYGSQFESEVECSMGMPCAGDPTLPDVGGCENCWDFFHVEIVYNDGVRERVRLIGANGDLPTTANINYSTACLDDKSGAVIEISTQTWASAEFIRADNIMLVCNEPTLSLDVDQVPIGSPVFCVGENVELEVRNPAAGSFEWFDPNGNLIGNNTSITFSASLIFGGSQSFSVVYTDLSGCKTRGRRVLLISDAPNANLPADITVCEGDPYLLRENGGDATNWSWDGPYSPNAGNFTSWNLTNLTPSNSGTYTVTVTDSGSCEGTESMMITVEPGGTLILPAFPGVCANGAVENLATTITGVTGNWSGPGITSNVLDPSMASGTFDITFTPTSAGCTLEQSTSVTITPAPTSSVPTSPLQVCGGSTADFDLTTLDSEVNGGSGEDVVWYEDNTLTTVVVDPTAFTSGNTTVFAVVEIGTCKSTTQSLDLEVTAGPEIMMAGQIKGCSDVVLNNIIILGQSGSQAYYDMPDGMGNLIPVGTVFTQDTVIYAYDVNLGCSDEQEIEITVGQSTDAGIDLSFEFCFIGQIALQTLVPSDADEGTFFDMNGDPIPNDTIDVDGGSGQFQLTYQTVAIIPCPPDIAIYSFDILLSNDAGRDSSIMICTGESIDVQTLTFDNGAEGIFQFSDGTPNPQTSFMMESGDQPFLLDFFYIVNSSGGCEPDTAFLRVEGLEQKTEEIKMQVCPDFNLLVFGVIYDRNNPTGSEMGTSVSGCDSIVNIDLQFRPINRVLINPVLCTGGMITVNGAVYDEGRPLGIEIFLDGDQFGCDSIVDIDLTFDNEIRTALEVRVCDNRDTTINSVVYNPSNLSGSTSLISSTGCDSIVEVSAIFDLASSSSLSGTYCPGDTILVEGEVFDLSRPMGMVISSSLNNAGCDSSIFIDLQFDLSFTVDLRADLCADMVTTINNTVYGAQNPGGIEIIENAVGCDSVLLIDFNILTVDSIFVNESFCNDTTLTINNVDYDRFKPEGEEIVVGGSTSGCNQYVFIELQYFESAAVDFNERICVSDSIQINGTFYSAFNPIGQEILLTAQGCDSLVNINLEVSGVEASFEINGPDCATGGDGSLTIEIQSGMQYLEDLLLDGVSILEDFENGVPIQNIPVGSHEVNIFSIDGCAVLESFVIEELEDEELAVTSVLIDEQFYQLGFSFTGEVSRIMWSPGDGLDCTNCDAPEARPASSSTYFLLVEDINGCTFMDSIQLSFLANSVLYQPNIFSPNEDGVNDVFFIDSEVNFEFKSFTIYDRWGNEVHTKLNGLTGDSSFGWSGDGYEQGVYIYMIDVEFAEGSQTIMGEVSLIR